MLANTNFFISSTLLLIFLLTRHFNVNYVHFLQYIKIEGEYIFKKLSKDSLHHLFLPMISLQKLNKSCNMINKIFA